jgi:hypothetical protein
LQDGQVIRSLEERTGSGSTCPSGIGPTLLPSLWQTKVIINVTPITRILVPSNRLSVASQQTISPNVFYRPAVNNRGVGIDVEGVDRTV